MLSDSGSLIPGLNLMHLFIPLECMCGHLGTVAQVWASEDNLKESGPLSHHVGLNQDVRPGDKCFY